jgi:hypothetical protein
MPPPSSGTVRIPQTPPGSPHPGTPASIEGAGRDPHGWQGATPVMMIPPSCPVVSPEELDPDELDPDEAPDPDPELAPPSSVAASLGGFMRDPFMVVDSPPQAATPMSAPAPADTTMRRSNLGGLTGARR